MEYIKQEGIGHKVQRLYIHWDITTICEYKCSYCYAREEYKDKWMRPGPWLKQLNVIEELKKATLPIFLGLLGGEPTSHHRYFEFLDLLLPALHHKDSRLYITSNGAKDRKIFEQHPESNGKLYMLWSYHPEYLEEKDSLEFIQKILIMKKKGYKTKVNIMLHPKKEYWPKTFMIIMALGAFDGIEVHPHFIYSSPHKPIKYSDEFYEYFSDLKYSNNKEFIFSDGAIENAFTDIEVFQGKLNKFKDWNCWNNNYEIGLDCRVNQFCFEEKHIMPDNYFKNITEIVSRKCPYEYCSCDGLLKIKKEK